MSGVTMNNLRNFSSFGGILILAAECLNTAIERIVDDISIKQRPAAKHAKDAGSAAVAITAIATGVAWLVIIVDLLSR